MECGAKESVEGDAAGRRGPARTGCAEGAELASGAGGIRGS